MKLSMLLASTVSPIEPPVPGQAGRKIRKEGQKVKTEVFELFRIPACEQITVFKIVLLFCLIILLVPTEESWF